MLISNSNVIRISKDFSWGIFILSGNNNIGIIIVYVFSMLSLDQLLLLLLLIWWLLWSFPCRWWSFPCRFLSEFGTRIWWNTWRLSKRGLNKNHKWNFEFKGGKERKRATWKVVEQAHLIVWDRTQISRTVEGRQFYWN